MKKNIFLVLLSLIFVYGCSGDEKIDDVEPLEVDEEVINNYEDNSGFKPSLKGPTSPPSVKGPTEPPE